MPRELLDAQTTDETSMNVSSLFASAFVWARYRLEWKVLVSAELVTGRTIN